MKHLRKLLFPFAAIYYVVVWIRNYLFDSGIWKSIEYGFPVICVGNLSVGGTGKTPMTEFLIRLLKEKYSVGVLSRGYGRSTSGYKLVDSAHKVKDVGDEPLQYRSKFDNITVAVCEDRREGIQQLRSEMSMPEIIVLDDAFQHRKVRAGFSILLTPYNELFYNDYVLPAGNLRESRRGAKRAQVVIVSKCPDSLSVKEQSIVRKQINKYSHSPVYFTTIDYSTTIYGEQGTMALKDIPKTGVTLVTGIAKPGPLLKFLESQNVTFSHKQYRDHHNFTSSELADLEKFSFILTTEKDYMRLNSNLKNTNLYYLPIEVRFLNGEHNLFAKGILDFARLN